VWSTAATYQIFHSIALLASPLLPSPTIVGAGMILGVLVFSGSCYLSAWTGDKALGKLAPIGGSMLIGSWLAIAFL